MCYNIGQFKNYLTIENAHFKVVADLQNIREVIDFCEKNKNTKKKVAEYYIFAHENISDSG